MLRRIVVLKRKAGLTPNLAAAFEARSIGLANAALDEHVVVHGVEFRKSYPIPLFRAASSGAPVASAAGTTKYGGKNAPRVVQDDRYAMVAEFDDQEAIERLKADSAASIVGVFADPLIQVAPAAYCANGPVGDSKSVRSALNAAALRKAGLTGKGVRAVVVDTGIRGASLGPDGVPLRKSLSSRAWSPQAGYVAGSAGVDHGTMVAYDILLGAPDVTLFDYALLQSHESTWTAFLSDALAGFSDLITFLGEKPGPLVVNNSWGLFDRSGDAPIGSAENYSANPTHPFNEMTGALVAAGADVLFAAGNCGTDCADGRCGVGDIGPGRSIHGANSHPSVITVAAVTVKNTRLGYSSQGPGGLSPKKPDIASFSHFAGSGVYAADGGTSAASPVAAGVVAALRQFDGSVAPGVLKGVIQSTAAQVNGAWSNDFGYGIIDSGAALTALKKLQPQTNPSKKGVKAARSTKKPRLAAAWMYQRSDGLDVAASAAEMRPPRAHANTGKRSTRRNAPALIASLLLASSLLDARPAEAQADVRYSFYHGSKDNSAWVEPTSGDAYRRMDARRITLKERAGSKVCVMIVNGHPVNYAYSLGIVVDSSSPAMPDLSKQVALLIPLLPTTKKAVDDAKIAVGVANRAAAVVSRALLLGTMMQAAVDDANAITKVARSVEEGAAALEKFVKQLAPLDEQIAAAKKAVAASDRAEPLSKYSDYFAAAAGLRYAKDALNRLPNAKGDFNDRNLKDAIDEWAKDAKQRADGEAVFTMAIAALQAYADGLRDTRDQLRKSIGESSARPQVCETVAKGTTTLTFKAAQKDSTVAKDRVFGKDEQYTIVNEAPMERKVVDIHPIALGITAPSQADFYVENGTLRADHSAVIFRPGLLIDGLVASTANGAVGLSVGLGMATALKDAPISDLFVSAGLDFFNLFRVGFGAGTSNVPVHVKNTLVNAAFPADKKLEEEIVRGFRPALYLSFILPGFNPSF